MIDENNTASIYPQKTISIVAVTWNLFGSLPPINSLVELSRSNSFTPAPDIIFIGTQECQRSLFLSIFCEAKSQWEAMLIDVFSQFILAATEVMRGLHTTVLIRNKLRDYYSIERKSKLRAGTFGIMANKGAISIEVSLLGQDFQLINCHLAPHQSGNDARNQTINRILNEMLINDLRHEIIFLGDFNYRIQMSKQEYHILNSNKLQNTEKEIHYSTFLEKEQMTNQQSLKRNFLKKFQEGKIDFPPTYKMGRFFWIKEFEVTNTIVKEYLDGLIVSSHEKEKLARQACIVKVMFVNMAQWAAIIAL